MNSLTIKSALNFNTFHDQGTKYEFTVVQKLNQGTLPEKDVIFSGLLFGYSYVCKRRKLVLLNNVKIPIALNQKSESMRVHFGLSNLLGMLAKRNSLILFIS
jgi:hypothetical protein